MVGRFEFLTAFHFWNAHMNLRDSTDKFIGPIVNAHTNLTEIDQTMDLFWRNNVWLFYRSMTRPLLTHS